MRRLVSRRTSFRPSVDVDAGVDRALVGVSDRIDDVLPSRERGFLRFLRVEVRDVDVVARLRRVAPRTALRPLLAFLAVQVQLACTSHQGSGFPGHSQGDRFGLVEECLEDLHQTAVTALEFLRRVAERSRLHCSDPLDVASNFASEL